MMMNNIIKETRIKFSRITIILEKGRIRVLLFFDRKEKIVEEKVRNLVKEYVLFIIGSFLAAFGTSCFLLPNQLSSGGFSGIATILYYLFHIPMGTTIMILNIPVFILAYIREGKCFVVKTIVSTVIFSWAINSFEKIPPFTTDKILASVYGGILIGIGLALVFKGKSSTVGTDLLANIIVTYRNEISVGTVLQGLDIFVVLLNIIFLGEIEIGLYSAIAIYIINKMLDLVFEGINFSKMIYIISDKYEEIAKIINQEIKRGATGIYGKGLYTNQEKMIVMCVAKRKHIIKIKEISKKLDEDAFIIITDAREVYGLGFKS